MLNLLWIFWDPQKTIVAIPYTKLNLSWYGVLFSLGFLVGYFIMRKLFEKQLRPNFPKHFVSISQNLTDRITWYCVIGTIVGARLGHVFFYDWPYYRTHLLDILKTWEGGLASHGGTIGILIALYFFSRHLKKLSIPISFLSLCDLLAIPTAFCAICIRLGNFMNQEIIGIPSELPWAIIFGHPNPPVSLVPRHPAQLYEAACYLLTFVELLYLSKFLLRFQGAICGLFFINVFASRFFIEFVKENQGGYLFDTHYFQTGQILSLPFIFLGISLLIYSYPKRRWI